MLIYYAQHGTAELIFFCEMVNGTVVHGQVVS